MSERRSQDNEIDDGNGPSCDMTLAQRCRCPNNSLLIIALLLLILFILFELGVRIYDLYLHLPPVDIPSHFFAGLAIAAGSFWVLSLNKIKHKKLVAVSITFIAACLWEVLETLDDKIAYNPPHLQDKFIWDGFFDIIVTTLGGIAFLLVIYFLKTRTEILKDVNI